MYITLTPVLLTTSIPFPILLHRYNVHASLYYILHGQHGTSAILCAFISKLSACPPHPHHDI